MLPISLIKPIISF